MSTKSSPRARSSDLGMVYWTVMLSVAGILIWRWFALDPGRPIYALALVCWTYGLGLAVADPIVRLLPRHWFNVLKRERVLHRILGVGIFGWLLERSGYNRHVSDPMLGFDRTRASLPALDLSLRANASAKGTLFYRPRTIGGRRIF